MLWCRLPCFPSGVPFELPEDQLEDPGGDDPPRASKFAAWVLGRAPQKLGGQFLTWVSDAFEHGQTLTLRVWFSATHVRRIKSLQARDSCFYAQPSKLICVLFSRKVAVTLPEFSFCFSKNVLTQSCSLSLGEMVPDIFVCWPGGGGAPPPLSTPP